MPHCNDWYYENTIEDIPGFIGDELIHYAKANLPVSSHAKDFSIAGVSMGGFGALLLGAKYAEQFGKIASLSGAFIIPDVVIGNQGVLGNADPNYFKTIFGSFDELEGSARDPLAEAIRAADQHKLPKLYMLCGKQDVLYRENKKIANVLRDHGAQVNWHEEEGSHIWDFWNRHLLSVVNWIADDF
jgi:S-formylglutathione hydrolase FrmB